MSYANGTQFYNLPQTVGTDKRDWFDTNSAFAAIDAALHSAVTGQASDAEAIATINGKLADDEADIAALQTKGNTHDSQIAALQTTVNTQASQIQDVRQDAEDMITANNEGAAATSTRAYAIGDYFIYNDVLYKATAAIAIGDTIVPNTNCEATNVDTEITQLNSDLGSKSSASTVTGDDAFTKIAELKSEIDAKHEILTVTGVQGDTYKTLLNKVWNAISMGKIRPASTLKLANNPPANISRVNSNQVQGIFMSAASNGVIFYAIMIENESSRATQYTLTTSGLTVIDISDTVVNNASIFIEY